MRVIICGAGQVGYNIASYLSRENNDITIIESDERLVAEMNETLDVKSIVGEGSNPDTLNNAQAGQADVIIAVTRSDESNMVACQIAHSLFNVPKKIARIRNQAYLNPTWANLFSRSNLPIDYVISPEIEVAKAIEQHLSIPGATNVYPMAEDRIHFCGLVCERNCPLLNTQISQIEELFSSINIRIICILREGSLIIPTPDDQLYDNDEVYFITEKQYLKRTLSAFGHNEKSSRNVLFIGGGNIGLSLAQNLLDHHFPGSIKMIESKMSRAHDLSTILKNVTVLHGDGLNREILEEANIKNIDTVVSVTNNDETNVLGALLAKQKGSRRGIALINNNSYIPLLHHLGVDSFVSPQAVTVSKIMRHIRRGRIKAVHNIRDGFAEVIEAEASESSSLINIPMKDLRLPKHVVIAAIIRNNNDVIIPRAEDKILAKDHVIVFTPQQSARSVEQLFSVQVDFF